MCMCMPLEWLYREVNGLTLPLVQIEGSVDRAVETCDPALQATDRGHVYVRAPVSMG